MPGFQPSFRGEDFEDNADRRVLPRGQAVLRGHVSLLEETHGGSHRSAVLLASASIGTTVASCPIFAPHTDADIENAEQEDQDKQVDQEQIFSHNPYQEARTRGDSSPLRRARAGIARWDARMLPVSKSRWHATTPAPDCRNQARRPS